LKFAVEYSSDTYALEVARNVTTQRSPINVAVDYKLRHNVNLKFGYLYGTTAAVQVSYLFNPKRPSREPRASDKAPLPVALRLPGAAQNLGWTGQVNAPRLIRNNLAKLMADDGMTLQSVSIDARRAYVQVRTGDWSTAQAIGRISRILTNVMPASVETFDIVPLTSNGVMSSRITLRRSDLEELEFEADGAWQMFARARIEDAADDIPGTSLDGTFKPFTWGFGPYVESSYFDPASPVRLDVGVEVHARWEPKPGLVFSGQIKQLLQGDRGDLVLWKPVNSRLALGAELNYVRQRDFDQRFGLQSYGVTTGHLSAYYKAGIKFSVPLSALTGQKSKTSISRTIRPVLRDGGARLRVKGRLYEQVRDWHRPGLQEQWGRFWR